MNNCTKATFVATFFLLINNFCPAQPPIELMDGTAAIAPGFEPGYRGPAIGISGSSYSKNGVNGFLVTQVTKNRSLWYLNSRKERKPARFAPGRDVILKVNDFKVASANDVLGYTLEGWNKITIRDLKTSATGEYWVELP